MNENVLKFYEVVSADGALQEELVAVTEGVDLDGLSEEEALQAMAEAVAEFAAAHDLDLAVADILEAQEAVTSGELSEEELAAVGGGMTYCIIGGGGKGCGCPIAGGGKGGCICFVFGAAS